MSFVGCAVWLYGSHARSVTDFCSDLDLFVAADRTTNIQEMEHHIPLALSAASVSRYTWDEISGMARYGSLFLQHLKLEAYPLYESPRYRGKLRRLLDNLGDYELSQRDLRGFRAVLEDVTEALDNTEEETYELSVLGTVIRHAAILGCWLIRQPSFGRTEPVSRFVQSRGLENVIATKFPELYDYRLYTDRRLGRDALHRLSGRKWLRRARLVVAEVEELAGERDR